MGATPYTIDIEEMKSLPGFRFRVTIQNGTTTVHEVTFDEAYWKKITRGESTPGELVQRSFLFLLRREPNSAILRSFSLDMIGRYFPEYEKEMQNMGRA